MDDPLLTGLSAIAGGGASAILAKIAFNKIAFDIREALRDVKDLSGKVAGIREDLSAVKVSVSKISEHEKILVEHDKQLARLETGGSRRR